MRRGLAWGSVFFYSLDPTTIHLLRYLRFSGIYTGLIRYSLLNITTPICDQSLNYDVTTTDQVH